MKTVIILLGVLMARGSVFAHVVAEGQGDWKADYMLAYQSGFEKGSASAYKMCKKKTHGPHRGPRRLVSKHCEKRINQATEQREYRCTVSVDMPCGIKTTQKMNKLN